MQGKYQITNFQDQIKSLNLATDLKTKQKKKERKNPCAHNAKRHYTSELHTIPGRDCMEIKEPVEAAIRESIERKKA